MTRPPIALAAKAAGRTIGLGLIAGIPAGLASYAFVELLDRAIKVRENGRGWLVIMLPEAAFVIAAVYHHWGGRAGGGTALVLGQADAPTEAGVPRRMAPMVMLATVTAHLFGASVGREGVALQMAASLADGTSRRVFRLAANDRFTLLHAALAGGFGSVFGVPWAGLVFAFEVRRRRPTLTMVASAATASWAGDAVVRLLGHEHRRYPRLPLDLGVGVLLEAALAGVAFGLVAMLFVAATDAVRRALARLQYPPWRAAAASTLVLAGSVVFGHRYLSLSVPLAAEAVDGARVPPLAWLAKLGFTAVSIGGGIPGGEVTPLFVTGATLGAEVARLLGAPLGLFAGLGFVAVFAAAARTPLACTVMFAELFGLPGTAAALIACVVARLVMPGRGIYPPPPPNGAK